MSEFKNTFQRIEKKYLLKEDTYIQFRKLINEYIVADKYGESNICNIYFDTPDFKLIRESIDKPVYKEKLRLRTYGVPNDDSHSFVEIKKKFKGIVYKRRISMKYLEAYNYLNNKSLPKQKTQVYKEIDYMFNLYKGLRPSMIISYKRLAYFYKENSDLRITFDSDILWRTDELDLRKGAYGNELLTNNQRVMEIKIPGSMPLWLASILDELKIYPSSYSKYGNAYKIYSPNILLPNVTTNNLIFENDNNNEKCCCV